MAYPPQQGQYGAQQQQYGGYPQQQGPYGGPPPKNKAPLVATVIFVVALLAGLGITGFVAPGFFLSDDKGGGGSSADGGDSGDAGQGNRPGGIGDGPADPTLRPGDAPADDSDPGSGSGDSGDDPASGPGGGSGGSGGDGEAVAEDFLAAVNAAKSTEANDMVCPDSPSNSLVDYVIKKDPELAIDTVDETKYFLDVKLKGTLGGKPLNLGKISVKLTGSGSPCVFTFNAG
jgi:hypothetical protein